MNDLKIFQVHFLNKNQAIIMHDKEKIVGVGGNWELSD